MRHEASAEKGFYGEEGMTDIPPWDSVSVDETKESLATSSPFENQWPIAPDTHPLIIPGVFPAVCLKYEPFRHFRYPKTRKLHLHFQVFHDDSDPKNYTDLSRFLNYSRTPGRGSDYYKEWVIANGGNPPKRKDRMSPKIFVEKIFDVRVRTVKQDRDSDPLHRNLRYSVVGKILRLVA
jgi:hypothetical protein